MKSFFVTALTGLAMFFLFATALAHAQAEIDPDHYDIVPADSGTTKVVKTATLARVHYEGQFTLPHDAKCQGKSLSAGAYKVSLDSDGKTAQVTLNRQDQALKIAAVPQRQLRYRGGDAIVVEHSGNSRELSAIHLARLDLVFPMLEEQEHFSAADRQIERVPVLWAASK